MNEERIRAELEERIKLTERTFHVTKKSAGFLGLGVRIRVIVNGEAVDETTVYGDTLYAIARHVDAQVSGNVDKIRETNENLPQRFQYPRATNTEL